MRFWVLVLAVLLLPLRAWTGDAMALQMATQALAVEMASPAPHVLSSAHEGHALPPGRTVDAAHLHEADAAPHVHADEDTDDAGCASTCGDCQLCHGLTAGLGIAPLPFSPLPRVAPALASPGFSSLAPAPSLKPPIT